LFAGSGALGIEAVSRGAASSTCVEQDRKTAEMLRESVKMLDTGEVVVYEMDALQWLKSVTDSFNIIFLDPPFGQNLIEKSLALLPDSGCVSRQSLIYVETEAVWQPEKNVEVIKQAKAGQVNYMLIKIVAD
jgi:16S rRNA (guanine966-N2)-methyltransferase